MIDLSVLGPPNANGALTLVEGIQRSLREAIANGSLPAGFRLREIPLAEHFGCSTTPVREALRRLDNEGLVKVHPRRGAEVTSVTSPEVDQLYELRMLLESHSVRRAAARKPGADELRAVRKIVDEQRAADEQSHDRKLDADFHRELTALAGNSVIAELVEKTVRQIEAVQARSHAMVEGERVRTCKAHAAIVAAIAKGDPDRAEHVMREHLERARHVVTVALGNASA
jgi:DNA-binding GntR family transcriptional regulator